MTIGDGGSDAGLSIAQIGTAYTVKAPAWNNNGDRLGHGVVRFNCSGAAPAASLRPSSLFKADGARHIGS